MTFIVDNREYSYMKRALRKVGLPVWETLVDEPGRGDFYWVTPQGLYCVEHKSVKGLVPDFFGRPTRQLMDMLQYAEVNNTKQAVLAIEGVCIEAPDGNCWVFQFSSDRRVFYRPQLIPVSFISWTAWKLSMSLRGIFVLEYPNTAALASAMLSMYNQTKDAPAQRTMSQYNTTVKYVPWQEQVLRQFPGIGAVRAKLLLNKYGTLFNIFQCEGDHWPLRNPSWDTFMQGATEWLSEG